MNVFIHCTDKKLKWPQFFCRDPIHTINKEEGHFWVLSEGWSRKVFRYSSDGPCTNINCCLLETYIPFSPKTALIHISLTSNNETGAVLTMECSFNSNSNLTVAIFKNISHVNRSTNSRFECSCWCQRPETADLLLLNSTASWVYRNWSEKEKLSSQQQLSVDARGQRSMRERQG